jgi:pimeloyl-ACP methyl ester carboxylesterase
VGHSYGGSICADYAGKHPEQIAGILFVDPAGDQRQIPEEQFQQLIKKANSDDYAEFMLEYWHFILNNAEEDVKSKVISSMQATQKNAVISAFNSMRQFDVISALSNYKGPKLSIIGDLNNQPFSLHNVVEGLPYKLISGTGHWLHMDRPVEFNKLMDEFLYTNQLFSQK